jgi:hypothetical protein
MAQVTLQGPTDNRHGPNINEETPERGWSFKRLITAINDMFTELYASTGAVAGAVLGVGSGYVLARRGYTVVADDDTAGTADIVTGLTTIETAIVQIRRAGVDVTADAVVTWAAGTITVADGAATYALTADDVVNVIAVGT